MSRNVWLSHFLLRNLRNVKSAMHQHMMEEMFLSANRPFFQSSMVMSLGSIDIEEYRQFANRMIEGQNRTIFGSIIRLGGTFVLGDVIIVVTCCQYHAANHCGKCCFKYILFNDNKVLHIIKLKFWCKYTLGVGLTRECHSNRSSVVRLICAIDE